MFFCVLVLLNSRLFSQTPSVIWQKCYGSYHGDYAYAIHQTTDGGFIVVGTVEGEGGDIMGYHGNVVVGDIGVLKLNGDGSIQWQKTLGGMSSEFGADVKQTPDGGYIVAGSAASKACDASVTHTGLEYWVVKLSATGNIVWQKSYGGSQNEYGYSIDMTSDGGYVMAGLTESNDGDITVNHGIRDYWVIKIDGKGKLLWQKSIGGSGDDEPNAIKATSDGGCIVVGYTESNDGDVSVNHGKQDAWIVKLDQSGSVQWQKSFGGSGYDMARSIQLTRDGGYIFAGTAGSDDGDVSGNHRDIYGNLGSDFWVVKLSSSGTLQWQKCYGGTTAEMGEFIQGTSDGGYVVAGIANSKDGDLSCNAGIEDAWVIKITSTGVLQWQKSIGGSYYDEAFSVEELSDGNYIVAGNSCSPNMAGHRPTSVGTCDDYLIVKLAPPATITPSAMVAIQPNGNICTAGNPVFTASVMYAGTNPQYQWLKNGGAVGSNSPVYKAAGLVNSDILTCNVSFGGGCETGGMSSGATITITAANTIHPQMNISASSTAICGCSAIVFKAAVTNGGASPVYKWMLNGIDTGVNGNIFISASLNSGDKISCAYADNSGCVAGGSLVSNTIVMSTATPGHPTVFITTTDTAVCAGSAVTFNASAANAGVNPVYQWTVNGVNAGTNNSSFTTTTLVNGDVVGCNITVDSQFTCAVANAALSNSITVLVRGKMPPTVVVSGLSDSICAGQPVTFTATAANAGTNPSYHWQVNGNNAGTNTNTFTSALLANGDTVACTITTDTAFKCATAQGATSNKVIVPVKSQQTPSAIIHSSINSVCAGTAIVFNVVAQNAGVSPLYQWVINNVPVNNVTNSLTTDTLFNGDALYCAVTPGKGGCTTAAVASNTIIAMIKPLPVVGIMPKDTTLVMGASIQLRGAVSANTIAYEWSPANVLTNPASLTPLSIPLMENNTFTLTAKSDKGCTNTAIAQVKVGQLLLMPTAFTPNGDGANDVFRIPAGVTLALQEFTVFNRFGGKVFTTQDIAKGWDGTYNGATADAGVYVYVIRGIGSKGPITLKGSLVLVR